MRRVGFTFLCVCLAISNSGARADCIDDAAIYHRLSPSLLRAIARQESGMRPSAINRNTNGSEDIG